MCPRAWNNAHVGAGLPAVSGCLLCCCCKQQEGALWRGESTKVVDGLTVYQETRKDRTSFYAQSHNYKECLFEKFLLLLFDWFAKDTAMRVVLPVWKLKELYHNATSEEVAAEEQQQRIREASTAVGAQSLPSVAENSTLLATTRDNSESIEGTLKPGAALTTPVLKTAPTVSFVNASFFLSRESTHSASFVCSLLLPKATARSVLEALQFLLHKLLWITNPVLRDRNRSKWPEDVMSTKKNNLQTLGITTTLQLMILWKMSLLPCSIVSVSYR